MDGIHDYGLFVLSAILLILAPGQDTLYIVTRSIGEGRRIGVASALGVAATQVRGFFERSPRVQAWLLRAMGGVFVFIGVRLAVSKR